jgi:MFS family permease
MSDQYTRLLAFVVLLAVIGFGALLTIVTVALGDIAEDLHSTRTTLTWTITATMLAMAVGSPLAGKLSDIHGPRRLFLLGLAVGAASDGVVRTRLECDFAHRLSGALRSHERHGDDECDGAHDRRVRA